MSLRERAEISPLGGGQARRTVGGQPPGLRIERHSDLELESTSRPRRPDVDAAQRPPAGPLARSKPIRNPLHPVDDALADDGSGDLPKTHALGL